jgi:hypothetical protein
MSSKRTNPAEACTHVSSTDTASLGTDDSQRPKRPRRDIGSREIDNLIKNHYSFQDNSFGQTIPTQSHNLEAPELANFVGLEQTRNFSCYPSGLFHGFPVPSYTSSPYLSTVSASISQRSAMRDPQYKEQENESGLESSLHFNLVYPAISKSVSGYVRRPF